MRNVQSVKNKTKSVYTAFDSVSLSGSFKLVISPSEWAAGFFPPAKPKMFSAQEEKKVFGFMP